MTAPDIREVPEGGAAVEPECLHDAVMTYSGVGAGRIWACEECKLRLYPACRECVVDGHRNGEHPVVALDVARLAKALPKAERFSLMPGSGPGWYARFAAAIVREYALLGKDVAEAPR